MSAPARIAVAFVLGWFLFLAFVVGRETGRHESYHFKIERDDARDRLDALDRFDRLIIDSDARMIRSFRPCP